MTLLKAIAMMVILAVVSIASYGQTVSGSVTGTVADPAGAIVAGAKVELKNELTNQSRQFVADSNGNFLFPDVQAGDYELRISQPGFKGLVQRHISVASQERVDVHTIRLELGTVESSIEVRADATHIATASSDHSIAINTTQIENTRTAGRNYLSLLRSLPGTAVTTTSDSRGANGNNAPVINGGQQGMILATVDGIGNWLSGTAQTGGYSAPSVDAIGEIQLKVGNYSAEYGSRAGGLVNVTIKGGTSNFHGSLYNYMRHEQFNANEWFNNATNQPKQRYRFQNPGGTIGGPVIIPGTNFNRSRTRLFFFFSEDYLHNITSNTPSRFTMPTALERSGDFSQTVTSTGTLIKITDPTTGVQFPGNLIPTNRISAQGSALMNLFPLPNTSDPSNQRQYNFANQGTQSNPRENRILRVDYGLGSKTTAYTRYLHDFSGNEGFGTTVGPTGSGWGQLSSYFNTTSWGLASTVFHTFRPSLILEATWGISRGVQLGGALDSAAYEKNKLPALKTPGGTSVTLPSLFPGANEENVIPNLSFGTSQPQSAGQAVTNAPSFGWGTFWPFFSYDTFHNVTTNLSWINGRHQTKFGFYYERVSLGAPGGGSAAASMGQFWFGSDLANANDTGYAFSNLLAGTVQSAQQDNSRIKYTGVYNQYEWFAQDTVRVARGLTLDLGVRFQLPGPVTADGTTFGLFGAASYKRSQSGQLLYPAIVNGVKVALNPVTNVTYPLPRAAFFDPASYPSAGSPFSGMLQYKGSFFNWPKVGIGPRVGFAWDVFGDGKTALRGGFSIVYGRPFNQGNQIAGNLAQAPPAYLAPQVFNTTFSSLLATPGFLAPQTVFTGSPNYPNPATYNWSIGIQRDLGKGFMLDAAYVGNVAHHLFGNAIDVNAIAPLTTWTPSGGVNKKYQDPTNATGGLYTTSLIRDLSGGYGGYNNINAFTSLGESNYNSLQVQVNRRFGSRFQMNANYTWSKTITFTHQQWVDDSLTKNVLSPTPQAPLTGQRPHVVNLNFGIKIPGGSHLWSNAFTKQALDGWNLSGVAAFFMGTPMTIGCTASNVPANLGNYWTGTPAANPVTIPFRCQMNGDLWLPEGATPASAGSTADPRLWYPFAQKNFVLPSATSLGIGNTPPTLTYGPGFQNWDLSLEKEFKLGEARSLQLRVDSFNTFNHFNPSNPNTALTYNFVTGAQTNAAFGTTAPTTANPTGTQNNARRASISARFRF